MLDDVTDIDHWALHDARQPEFWAFNIQAIQPALQCATAQRVPGTEAGFTAGVFMRYG